MTFEMTATVIEIIMSLARIGHLMRRYSIRIVVESGYLDATRRQFNNIEELEVKTWIINVVIIAELAGGPEKYILRTEQVNVCRLIEPYVMTIKFILYVAAYEQFPIRPVKT